MRGLFFGGGSSARRALGPSFAVNVAGAATDPAAGSCAPVRALKRPAPKPNPQKISNQTATRDSLLISMARNTPAANAATLAETVAAVFPTASEAVALIVPETTVAGTA